MEYIFFNANQNINLSNLQVAEAIMETANKLQNKKGTLSQAINLLKSCGGGNITVSPSQNGKFLKCEFKENGMTYSYRIIDYKPALT